MFQSLVKYFSFRYNSKVLPRSDTWLFDLQVYSLLWLQKLYDVLAQVHDGTVSFTYMSLLHTHALTHEHVQQ